MLLLFMFQGLEAERAPGAQLEVRSSETRAFAGQISREMAAEAAFSAARLKGLRLAERSLAGIEEIRLLLGSETLGSLPRPDPLALALALLREEREAFLQVEGEGSGRNLLKAEISLRLEDVPGNRRKIGVLTAHPLWLDYYARAVEFERLALQDYDQAAAPFLRAGEKDLSLPRASPAQGEPEGLSRPWEDLFRDQSRIVRAAADRLAGIRAYIELIPALRELELRRGGEDISALRELQHKMEEMNVLYPENYLLLAEAARLHLLRHDLAPARSRLDAAINLENSFSPALDLRGVLFLALGFPSLALEDFSRAITLRPDIASFYENRALALRILEETPAMCLDLAQSCRLGSCSGLKWAAGKGLCAE
ncbi:MAG: hypothetical protein LBQ63_07400 [Deltaproteobacteria bacterium]|nr:hypothetical protein [Deltaproteobacteria bacterium]